ncbi:MAG: metallophosphoesterase [Candidatus Kerfeldbacteria bacterium]|nr:metallophosphoesterase [Candidatus Kerfeldbacteria bacterium]
MKTTRCAQGAFSFLMLVLGVCIVMPTPSHASTSGVTFGPYVQRVKKTAMSILLRTDSAISVRLKYREVGASDWTVVTDSATTEHAFRITDLSKDKRYQYYFQDSDKNRLTSTYTFATKHTVSDDQPLRIGVFGDSGVLSTHQFRIGMQMQWWSPDILLHTGDIAYEEGTLTEFANTFFTPYQPLIAQVPFYGTVGNHDYATDAGAPYKNVFETPTKYSDVEDYYAFDYGPAHIVSLNTSIDYTEGSAQYEWLTNDLAQSDKKWKIVFFHFPVWSSGRHGSTEGLADALSPIFEEHGVQLVINGHDHAYEHNYTTNGVLYLVTGGGGAPLYTQEHENAHSYVFESIYHFLGIEITKESLSIQAIDENGYTFDTIELTQ